MFPPIFRPPSVLKKTSDLMGHVDIRMTAWYVHLRRVYDPDIERIMQDRPTKEG